MKTQLKPHKSFSSPLHRPDRPEPTVKYREILSEFRETYELEDTDSDLEQEIDPKGERKGRTSWLIKSYPFAR